MTQKVFATQYCIFAGGTDTAPLIKYALLVYSNSDTLQYSRVFYDATITGMNLMSLFIEDVNNVKALMHGIFLSSQKETVIATINLS